MAMITQEMQKIMTFANRRTCVMAVVPWGGGCWPVLIQKGQYANPEPGSADSGSWAVKNGLLKFENIKRTPEGFTVDKSNELSGIYTKLDFRETTILLSRTFLVKAMCPWQAGEVSDSNASWGYDLISQGIGSYYKDGVLSDNSVTYSGLKKQCFNLSVWGYNQDSAAPRYTGMLVFESPDVERAYASRCMKEMSRNDLFDRFNVFAMKIVAPKYTLDTSSVDCPMVYTYLNGELIGSGKGDAQANVFWQWSTPKDSDMGLHPTVGVCVNNFKNTTAKHVVQWALGFNNALSDEEIKELSTAG